MPEGDTVWRTSRRLDQAFAGNVCTRAELRWGTKDGTPLQGRTTLEVVPRGKHILHRFAGGLTLHSHLRMEGSWYIDSPSSPSAQDHRVRAVLGTGRWWALGMQLGMLDLVRTSDEHTLVGHLGPDILGADWNETTAVANLRSATGTIGAALLGQRNLAGVGTLYACESLFAQRLYPWLPAANAPEADVVTLVRRARRLMRANLEHPVQSTTGSRRHGDTTYVHARSGRPCRRCGAIVLVSSVGTAPYDRVMFYCPSCQGGLAPGASGRTARW